ncbi:phosphatase PAP2 family protein [Campylobacter sputorum]|uniref:phosphatase PAP2 family protein n=1 Tax=Campylobacter sputorum TaxID=206 RepID=UPI001E48C667|nr:phosphatase PAP2 family protein [Campylobacter sputorum]
MVLKNSIFITGFLLVLVILLFEYTDIDIMVQNHFYDIKNGWLVDRNDKMLYFIFYSGVKKAIVIFGVILSFMAVFYKKLKLNLANLLIVLLSLYIVPSTVSLLKKQTNMPCPVNLEIYGGSYPDIGLFERYPKESNFKRISCYPAGHASGGFAMLSLVFLCKKKRTKAVVFVLALTLGWTMGLYKMMIGDHFLSHTIVSMLMAWLEILIISKLVYKKFNKLSFDYPKNQPQI